MILALSLAVASAAYPAENPILPLDPEKPLQVVISDQVIPRSSRGFSSWSAESDRYFIFTAVLERELKRAGYNGKITTTRFAANNPEAEQRLSVFIQRWERARPSFGYSFTADVLFFAQVEVGGETYDMGAFSAQETHLVMSSLTYDDFAPAAERAIRNAIEFYKAAIKKERDK